MNKLKRYIPNIIISILLVFAIIASEALVLTKATALNTAICIDVLKEKNIPDKVVEQLQSYFDGIEASTSIPSDVYMSVITKEEVEKSLTDGVVAMYDYIDSTTDEHPSVKYDFTKLEASITKYFETYADENDFAKDEIYDKQLANAIESAETEITSNLDVFIVSMIDSTGLFEKARQVISILPKANVGVAVLLVVLIAAFILVNMRNKQDILYWLATSFFTSSLIVVIPTIWIKYMDYFSKFTIKTPQIYLTVTGLLENVTDTVITFEILMFVLSLLMFAGYGLINHKTTDK